MDENDPLPVIQQLRAELESSKAARLRAQAGAERLATVRGALGTLAAAVLRRVGLYEIAHRSLRRVLRRPPAAGSEALALAPATAIRFPSSTRWARPSLLEARLLARTFEGAPEDAALQRLYGLGRTLRRVLCLDDAAGSLPAALMLAAGGAEVVCLGGDSRLELLPTPGLIVAPELGTFMLDSGRSSLSDFDAVLLGPEAPPALGLLRGRLGPRALLLSLSGRQASGPQCASEWGPPLEEGPGLRVYAPLSWQDPSHLDPDYRHQRPWRAEPRRIALPRRLPSGRPWPRISVVTASLNQGAYLEQTLLSVLRQDYPDLEYIVVDGESSDATPAILARYRDRLAHCIVEKDAGQSDALNKGFARASGGILAWLNGDDRYPPGALWRAALAFDAYGADVVAGGCALVQGDADDAVGVHHPVLPVGTLLPLPLERLLDLEGSWRKGDFFYQPEVFWTRELWERSGGRVATELFYTMDYELWLRFAKAGGRVVHVPDTLAQFRLHPQQKTAGEDPPYAEELRRVSAAFRSSRTASPC